MSPAEQRLAWIERMELDKLRHRARKQGLRIQKCRTTDNRSPDYGKYYVFAIDAPGGHWSPRKYIAGPLTLEELGTLITSAPSQVTP